MYDDCPASAAAATRAPAMAPLLPAAEPPCLADPGTYRAVRPAGDLACLTPPDTASREAVNLKWDPACLTLPDTRCQASQCCVVHCKN